MPSLFIHLFIHSFIHSFMQEYMEYNTHMQYRILIETLNRILENSQ